MRLPSLRNLQVFESAARHKSFREAADAMFLTHSAVGKQIKALEVDLGVELFVRVGRRVVLTQHGERLLSTMSDALQQISATIDELRSESLHPTNRLPITVVPSFAARWLSPRLGDFHARHPEIIVELIPTIATLDLSAKQIPLGIRMGAGNWDGLEAERLAREVLIPVVAADGVEGFDALPISVHDVIRYPLLNPYDEWEQWFKCAAVKGQPVTTGTTYEDSLMLLRAVEERRGIALGRKWLVMDAIKNGRLVRIPGPTIKTKAAYYLVYPKAVPIRADVKLFVSWIKEQVQYCVDAGPAFLNSP